jgi:hypothetical protein
MMLAVFECLFSVLGFWFVHYYSPCAHGDGGVIISFQSFALAGVHWAL